MNFDIFEILKNLSKIDFLVKSKLDYIKTKHRL